MYYLTGIQQINNVFTVLLGLVVFISCALFKKSNEISSSQSGLGIKTAAFSSLLFTFSILIMTGITSQTFLYFIFLGDHEIFVGFFICYLFINYYLDRHQSGLLSRLQKIWAIHRPNQQMFELVFDFLVMYLF
ncbi:MAG: hypothetical protein ACJARP_003204 [Vicingaceae bacterium]|jgi:hypothetical protein